MKKIVLAIGGSSGALYAKVLMDRLLELNDQWEAVGVVASENAHTNWRLEIKDKALNDYPFDFYERRDFQAPFASGSARYDAMIVCPCSMGLLGRLAAGISNDLATRAADVMLKERRPLILLTRETPLNLIHLENMTRLTRAGAIILPACPSFYSQPQTPEDIARTVVDRALDLAGFRLNTFRWGE
ncbi:MAG: UbiX family flavin prenyltransferase [Bacteroidetes bacterium]|nr:MAG: UbiX family flavin prenyltransferase [Bacteroidota bacterium]